MRRVSRARCPTRKKKPAFNDRCFHRRGHTHWLSVNCCVWLNQALEQSFGILFCRADFSRDKRLFSINSLSERWRREASSVSIDKAWIGRPLNSMTPLSSVETSSLEELSTVHLSSSCHSRLHGINRSFPSMFSTLFCPCAWWSDFFSSYLWEWEKMKRNWALYAIHS